MGITDFLDSEKGVTLSVEGLEQGDEIDFAVDPISGQDVEPAVLSAKADENGVASTIVYGTAAAAAESYIGDYQVTVDVEGTEAANAGQDAGDETVAADTAAAADELTATFSVVADEDAPGDDGNGGEDGDRGNGGDNGSGDNGSDDNGSDDGKSLPRTGASIAGLGLGLGAIVVGAGSLLIARRRRA